MNIISRKEFKCPCCKAVVSILNVYHCGSDTDFVCSNCNRVILNVRRWVQDISIDLNIKRTISQIFYKGKEIVSMEVNDKGELEVEYKTK